MASPVTEFYRDKNVFITGGTGFLGIALVEKIIRCCSDVKNVYLLIRPKKGKNAQDRLKDVIKNSVFQKLRQEEKTELFSKIKAVAGDVGEENLGLSTMDRLMLVEQIHIVFHSAATLDFEADLKSTANINLLGTRRVVEFCKEIQNLKALIHVSSAYVNATLSEAVEKIYPAPMDVEEFLKKVKTLSDKELEEATPGIIKDHPNSYTFTKHLAEHEVGNSKLPAVIIRPSMIVGAWKEPLPGWTISKNGPQGFIMGAGKGIVRRLPVAKNLIYDYIPVDIVVNSLVIAPYSIERDRPQSVKVYHLTSSTSAPFKWDDVMDDVNHYLHMWPLASAVWYPHLKLVPSLFWFRISAFFAHMIPAYILDTVTRIAGGKPILVRLHNNVNKSLARLEKFIFSEWKFYNTETEKLFLTLNEYDKEKFNLNVRLINWDNYFIDLTIGVRVYLHNEPLKNLNKAKRKDNILFLLHVLLKSMILIFIWWVIKASFGLSWTQTCIIVPIAYYLLQLL